TDTVLVAVLGPQSALSTAFVDGELVADVAAGATVTVPVLLDLSRAAPDGDLGSLEFELAYDAEVLVYGSAAAGVEGSAEFHVPAAGSFKFGFVSTDPQDAAELTLVTLTFEVAAGAAVGTVSELSLVYPAAPTSADFVAYATPVAVGGRVRIVAP